MAENLGEMLLGDRIENSPYVFQMHVEERGHIICTMPGLTAEQVDLYPAFITQQCRSAATPHLTGSIHALVLSTP
eukprot:scaffold7935_cov417-Prasinococcus_capsulatus_cf.AAC.2